MCSSPAGHCKSTAGVSAGESQLHRTGTCSSSCRHVQCPCGTRAVVSPVGDCRLTRRSLGVVCAWAKGVPRGGRGTYPIVESGLENSQQTFGPLPVPPAVHGQGPLWSAKTARRRLGADRKLTARVVVAVNSTASYRCHPRGSSRLNISSKFNANHSRCSSVSGTSTPRRFDTCSNASSTLNAA